MERNYETLSLETHLFFGRIMKEHAFFLMAGFPAKNASYIKEADWYRMQFEALLRDTVRLSGARISEAVLASDEIVTEYTMGAERQTEFLTGIQIDRRITEAEQALCASHGHWKSADNRQGGCGCRRKYEPENGRYGKSGNREKTVRELNRRALRLTDGLIDFKEKLLRDLAACRLFTFNYPLLIEHILREAKMYRSLVGELERTGTLRQENMRKMEAFWNQIMMEHALFIRGLLDPSEEALIKAADGFADDYRKLLDEAKAKDCMTWEDRTRECADRDDRTGGTIEETMRYRDFKAAGTEGIMECKIAGLILPLLADHVLREANHYLRLLDEGCEGLKNRERYEAVEKCERCRDRRDEKWN